jgi:sugar lactone lactonase YvrE
LTHDPENDNSIASNKIRAIAEAPDGKIWIGYENHGIDSYDKVSKKIEHFQYTPGDTNALLDNRIVALEVDPRGRIWIGTRAGLNVYDPRTEKHIHFAFEPVDPGSLVSPVVLGLYFDSKGIMWAGTDYGVHLFDQGLNRIGSYFPEPENPKGLKGGRIMFIGEDFDGYYWLGTIGSGLSRFEPSTGEFINFSEKDGLPNNVTYAALDDGNGFLWISTNKGLTKFDKKNESFVVYDAKDGIQGNEFNAGAYFRNKEGELFFGGMNGFNVFHPEDIKVNMTKPKIVITEVSIYNEQIPGTFYDGDTIVLRHTDNFFSIKFSALEYTNPSKNIFRYKLENYDKDWINTNAARRVAEYKKVSAGNYVFRVIGANNDGIWNQEGATLYLIITPPWWETWAFRIPFALVVIISFWLIIYSRFKTLKKKHDVEKKMLGIEKEMFEIEQKALRLQMNPHFIFNSLNAIQSFVIANDTDKAIAYLAKFSHLMRMILANSSESYIPLRDELKAVRYYIDLEKLRFDDKFDYAIELDESIDEEFVEIPPMILQPYVENAIIHG